MLFAVSYFTMQDFDIYANFPANVSLFVDIFADLQSIFLLFFYS